MDEKLKQAISDLAGYAAGRPPMAVDAFVPLKDVRFSTGGGDELMAFMTALDGEVTLTQSERERVVTILSFAETAMDGGEPLVIGFVNEQLEPCGIMLSVREANFVQMLANVCWGITTRLDEPMPRVARAPAASTASAMDPDSLPSLGADIVNPTSTPGPTPTASAQPPAEPTPVQPQAPPAPQRFVKTTLTGPEDPKWIKIRKEWLDPLFERRERADAACDGTEVKRVDEELAFMQAILLHACIRQFVTDYGYDNASRVRYYIAKRQNRFYLHERERFESCYGPVELML